jgi:hypothetical protein
VSTPHEEFLTVAEIAAILKLNQQLLGDLSGRQERLIHAA